MNMKKVTTAENLTKEKSLIEFLIEDFKDTSAKLESTDKKIQFVVQIYAALVTIIISASIPSVSSNLFIGPRGMLINASVKAIFVSPIFFVIVLFLAIFVVFVYCYSLRGGYAHTIYIARMNFLRNVIIKKIGVPPEQIKNFSYTQKKPPSKFGMGSTVCWFLAVNIGIYIGILLSFITKLISLNILVGSVGMILLHQFVVKKRYDNKLKEEIKKGWKPTETNESSCIATKSVFPK